MWGCQKKNNERWRRLVRGVFTTESCSTMDTNFFLFVCRCYSCLCISLLTRHKDHDREQDQSWLVRFGPCGDVQHLKKGFEPTDGRVGTFVLITLHFPVCLGTTSSKKKPKSSQGRNFGDLQLNNSISKQSKFANSSDCNQIQMWPRGLLI